MGTETATPRSSTILGRIIDPGDPSLSPEAARFFLGLAFPGPDQDRVTELLTKNQDGQLNGEERAELDEYLRADAILAMLKSKARVSLKRAGLKS